MDQLTRLRRALPWQPGEAYAKTGRPGRDDRCV